MVKIPLTRCRCEHDRAVQPKTEQLSCRVNVTGINPSAGDQLDPVKRIAIAPQRELRLRPVSGVVVDRQRHVRAKHRLKVERGDHLVEAQESTVIAER